MKQASTQPETSDQPECYGQKYLAVRNHILGAIRSGNLQKGAKVPSEYVLADNLCVNKTTCNKAVSTLVADGYLERRKGAGTYVVGEFARTAPTIGILTDLEPETLFYRMFAGIQQEAATHGYGVMFFQAPRSAAEKERFPNYIQSTGIKGLIINTPYGEPLPGIQNIYMNTAVPNPEVHQVQNDHFNGGYLMGKHFAENGHEYVAFVSKDDSRNDLLRRVQGFQKAIGDNRLRGAYAKLKSYARAETNLANALSRLLRMDNRISAIGFDTIQTANEAYHVLKRLNRRMPDDISVAGFGNLYDNEQMIRLTTIDQRPGFLGHATAKALIGLIEGHVKENVNITIPVQVLRGDSVCCLKQN